MRFYENSTLFASTVLVLVLVVLVMATAQPLNQGVRGNVFTSEDWPKMRVEVDRRMRYVGNFSFRIEDIAAGTRYVWAEADNRRLIRRMFVIQSEGMLPTTDEVYRYPIKSPAKLGRNQYQHNVSFVNAQKDATKAPGKEAGLLLRFLQTRRYRVEPEQIVSRFARHGGEGEKREIIFFYFENLTDYGRSLRDFPDYDEHPTEEQTKIKNIVEAHSRNSFRVKD